MIAYCLACAEPFLRLNQGKVFPLQLQGRVEFFWLCQACARVCDVEVRNGSPVIVPLDPAPGSTAA